MRKFFTGSFVTNKYTKNVYRVNTHIIGLYELEGISLDEQVFVNIISMFKHFRLASKAEQILYIPQ